MTDQEKQAMLAFLGTMHAQAKATDQMIVGQSQYLKPASPTIQNQFAQVLQAPTTQHIEQQPQYVEPAFVPQQPVFTPPPPPPEAQLEFKFEPPPPEPQPSVVSTELIDVLNKINLNIERIANILEPKSKPNARTKNPKKE